MTPIERVNKYAGIAFLAGGFLILLSIVIWLALFHTGVI